MSAPDPTEWAGLAPHPGDHDLPPGRHALHRSRLLTAIAQEPRTRKKAPTSLRPALAAAAVVLVAAGGALAVRSGDRPPVALPSPEVTRPAARPAPPGTAAKKGYATVRQLTDSADLVVRGEVASTADGRAVYRVTEVLYRAPDAPVASEITVAAEWVGTPGRPTVLYLGLTDPAAHVYAPLGGDVGIFDVAGESVTSRSSVTGLRTEDATTVGRAFGATLADLRQLARERG